MLHARCKFQSVLHHGPRQTGDTLLAQVSAREAQVPVSLYHKRQIPDNQSSDRQTHDKAQAECAAWAGIQEEQAAVRADARAEIEGRQAEVDAAQARSRDQAKQLSEMFAMLQVRDTAHGCRSAQYGCIKPDTMIFADCQCRNASLLQNHWVTWQSAWRMPYT